jgi:hypothetical protein
MPLRTFPGIPVRFSPTTLDRACSAHLEQGVPMTLVIIRILLRYLAAMLVARGLLSGDISNLFSNDPDFAAGLDLMLGGALAAVAEGWYLLAHRFGWKR